MKPEGGAGAEEECHVGPKLLLVDPICKYSPLHLDDVGFTCENLSMYLLGYQTSVGQSENITDENLSKKANKDFKWELTILCIGWIAWWFSSNISPIRAQVSSS